MNLMSEFSSIYIKRWCTESHAKKSN